MTKYIIRISVVLLGLQFGIYSRLLSEQNVPEYSIDELKLSDSHKVTLRNMKCVPTSKTVLHGHFGSSDQDDYVVWCKLPNEQWGTEYKTVNLWGGKKICPDIEYMDWRNPPRIATAEEIQKYFPKLKFDRDAFLVNMNVIEKGKGYDILYCENGNWISRNSNEK